MAGRSACRRLRCSQRSPFQVSDGISRPAPVLCQSSNRSRAKHTSFASHNVFVRVTTAVEHQPRGVNMVSAMVTVMTKVFSTMIGHRLNVSILGDGATVSPLTPPFGTPVNHCRLTPRLQAKSLCCARIELCWAALKQQRFTEWSN